MIVFIFTTKIAEKNQTVYIYSKKWTISDNFPFWSAFVSSLSEMIPVRFKYSLIPASYPAKTDFFLFPSTRPTFNVLEIYFRRYNRVFIFKVTTGLW